MPERPDPADVEALVEVLWGAPEQDLGFRTVCGEVAAHVLASDWLREHDRLVREAVLTPVLALADEWDRARILNPSFGVATHRATAQLRAAAGGGEGQ